MVYYFFQHRLKARDAPRSQTFLRVPPFLKMDDISVELPDYGPPPVPGETTPSIVVTVMMHDMVLYKIYKIIH